MTTSLDEIKRKSGLIGDSDAIIEVLQTIAQIAPTDISVLVAGESGTGKEMVAKAIHKTSRRKFERLVTVNCGAIPSGIIESELFGHKKGAFTGASESREGYFEAADKGTIFLDEIGETPLETQVKLLRVIEQGEFMRVGDNTTRTADVRIVAASNKNLADEVRHGNFRQDLFYRLKTVTIKLPALRDHLGDIPALLERFGLEFAARNDIAFKGFAAEAIRMLRGYAWPGNVRELKNIVESLLALNPNVRITAEMLATQLPIDNYAVNSALPMVLHTSPSQAESELVLRQLLFIRQDINEVKQAISGQNIGVGAVDPYLPSVPLNIDQQAHGDMPVGRDISNIKQRSLIDPDAIGELTIAELEHDFIKRTLERFNHNRRRTAEALGIAERTLYRKIQTYGLEPK